MNCAIASLPSASGTQQLCDTYERCDCHSELCVDAYGFYQARDSAISIGPDPDQV